MKKITFLLALITNLFSFSQTFTVDDIDYTVNTNEPTTVTIIGSNITGDLVIPEQVTDPDDVTLTYTVTRIADDAFSGLDNSTVSSSDLTSVVFPNTITSIGINAFRNHSNLENFTLPSSIVSLGDAAFRNCPKLTELTFPANLTRIGANCFGSARLITAITLLGTTPPTVRANSFDVENNIDLTIPDGTLQAYFDAGWSGYKTTNGQITLGNVFEANNLTYLINSLNPATVEVTGGNISTANNNRDLVIPPTVNHPTEEISFTITSVGNSAFRNRNLTGLTLPNTITTLAFRAFRDNGNLKEVTLPENLTEIGSESFFLGGLTQLVVLNPTPIASVNAGTFGDRSIIDLFVPTGALSAYQTDSRWQGFKSITEGTPDATLSSRFLTPEEITVAISASAITINLTTTNPIKNAEVYNLLGQKVIGTTASQILIDRLTEGIYLLIVETDEGNYVKKFAKQ